MKYILKIFRCFYGCKWNFNYVVDCPWNECGQWFSRFKLLPTCSWRDSSSPGGSAGKADRVAASWWLLIRNQGPVYHKSYPWPRTRTRSPLLHHHWWSSRILLSFMLIAFSLLIHLLIDRKLLNNTNASYKTNKNVEITLVALGSSRRLATINLLMPQ